MTAKIFPNSETFRLMSVFESHPMGISKSALLQKFYSDFGTCSPMRRMTLEIRLNKVLQRLRARIESNHGSLKFCRKSKIWTLSGTPTRKVSLKFIRQNHDDVQNYSIQEYFDSADVGLHGRYLASCSSINP